LKCLARLLLITTVGIFTLVPAAAAASCKSLASMTLKNATITSASLVAAGQFSPPKRMGMFMPRAALASRLKKMPAFCRVTAALTPTSDSDIKIEVWMPAQHWNGKLVGVGNGIWAGSIDYLSLADPVSRGYAVVATDTGHTGNGMSAKWAVGHKQKLIDFGYRAVHLMTVQAKRILAAYYGRKQHESLWVSCSTGGRQGLMEAYRYPHDYNGISAMAPANPMVNLMIGSLWTGYVALQDPAHHLTRSDLTAVHKAFLKQCGAQQSLNDGIITNPQACHFNPGTLLCKGHAQSGCLTAPQLTALREIYAGPRNPRTGAQIYPGFEPGSELQLPILVDGSEPFPVATSYFADLVFHNPKWNFKSFNYDTDLPASHKVGSAILDVPPSGLKKFLAGGGKLLLSHGWADGLIPSLSTVDFYRGLTATLPATDTKNSVRLFMIPGMGHCGGGDAPTSTNMLSVINHWVTTGKAPSTIVAVNSPRQKPASQLVCPYPKYARYKGTGDPHSAANFACTAP
jgi:feruloyl esterase